MTCRTPYRRLVQVLVQHGLAVAVAGRLVAAQSATTRDPSPGTRRHPDDSAAVAATVGRFHAALAAGDSVGALAVLAPGAVIVESGDVETRAEYRALHLGADITFARAVPGVRGPVRATVRGDAAWALSTSTTTGTFRGRSVDATGAELMVLTRETREWRIVAIHWSSRPRRPPRAP